VDKNLRKTTREKKLYMYIYTKKNFEILEKKNYSIKKNYVSICVEKKSENH